jgi:hypothetical protein
MPELTGITYSRDGCIAAVRDYSKFLVEMYLDPSAIVEPPERGWPDVTADVIIQSMGKTVEVLELLRHLPYIRDADDDIFQAQGSARCEFEDWNSACRSVTLGRSTAQGLKNLSEGISFSDDVPGQVIGLTRGGQSIDIFLLDTALGVIYWPECIDEIRHSSLQECVMDDLGDWAPENEADWRGDAAAWTIQSFFEVLKDQFRALNFIPISEYVVLDVHTLLPAAIKGLREMVQDIYRAHGWPDMQLYHKRECLDAVRKAIEERYPNYFP